MAKTVTPVDDSTLGGNYTLSKFIANVKNTGLARQNRYLVLINNGGRDSKLPTNLFSNNDFLVLFCESATLPGLEISTAQTRTYGEVREFPYDRVFDNVPMSFYMDNNMQIKNFFDRWMELIVDPVTRDIGYYSSYISTVTIFQLDLRGNETYMVQLFEAYPKALDAMTLNYGSRDVHTLRVSMNYKYWTSNIIQQDMSAQNDVPGLFAQAAVFANDIAQGNFRNLTGFAQFGAVNVAKEYFKNFTNFQNSIIPGTGSGAITQGTIKSFLS